MVVLVLGSIFVGNVGDKVKDELKGMNYFWRKFFVGRFIVGFRRGRIRIVIVLLCYGDGRNFGFFCLLF